MPNYKHKVLELLKSLETGDGGPISFIDPDKYIQHNPRVADGLAGFRDLLASRPRGSTTVNTVRAFQDGHFVFTHTEYDFSGKAKIGFDIFRFEEGKIVEHWDNQQETAGPSPSGHTMVDGPEMSFDPGQTEANKALMKNYMEDLLAGRREKFPSYFDGNHYIQHNPWVADDLTGLLSGLKALAQKGLAVKYNKVERILGEGNFVLVVSDGLFGDKPTAYYDLYRVQEGKIAEHWDTLEAIPPQAEWKNPNGKF